MRNFLHPAGQSRCLTRAFWLTGVAFFVAVAPHAAQAQIVAAAATNASEESAAADDSAAAAEAGEATTEIIVVSARNKDERLVDVPIPISVLSSATIDQQHINTLADVTQRAPGLTVTTPNARRTGVSLRGIGKTSGNDNMEAAVGVIVDDVFLDHVGMTYQDFTDLAQIEILRGPQGTLLGKNTSLGVIKYTSKAPSFTPEVEVPLARKGIIARGSLSDAVVPDLLAFRAIPAGDTEMRREHRVPLSRQAVEIICSMKPSARGSEFVFPSYNTRRPLSKNAVNGALRRLGSAGIMTAHGFRSTASSLLNESAKWQADAIERALAHMETNAVKAAYNRTTYWRERASMH